MSKIFSWFLPKQATQPFSLDNGMEISVSPERLAKLSRLNKPFSSFAKYVKQCDLPCAVLKLNGEQQQAFTYNEALGRFHEHSSLDRESIVGPEDNSPALASLTQSYREVAAELVDGLEYPDSHRKPLVTLHTAFLTPITSDVLQFDQHVFKQRWNSVNLAFTQDQPAPPDDILSSIVHNEHATDAENEDIRRYKPDKMMARYYIIRIKPKTVFLKDSIFLSAEGRALLKGSGCQDRMSKEDQRAYRQRLTDSKWSFQSEPCEVTLSTDWTLHFSGTPLEPMKSCLLRIGVKPAP
ncbi:MAG: hypothetical protein WDO70_07450 [Alphaproteobacteria bacterium]